MQARTLALQSLTLPVLTTPKKGKPIMSAVQELNKAQHLNWETIPVEHPAEGIERQLFVGEQMMICRFRFAPFLVTPQHTHPHEQMSLVISGRIRFFVEGEERIASPGDVLHFPPNCLHGATMMEEEVVLIDIFTPLREDFLGK
ncbi:MAG TPA: cupin domain-containing protein [Blastocatellia bacterium]|nr:cupin domain-containing protein [Blastocatellia bacterium]